MDIGVFSDIHGDFRALQTVLDRLEHEHKVDYILCAGDLIGRGSEPDAVTEMIRERGIPAVRGNHDEWVYNVSADNGHYLRQLPLDLRCSYGDMVIFMCHGKPGSNLWGLYHDHISKTLLNMMLESLQVDVLITGHTHVPMYIRVDRGCVINPGSAYTFKSVQASSRTYGILRLPDLTFDFYDVITGRMKSVMR